MNPSSPHTFHIPVMGIGYTIDTPVKVARYGIASVISIVEDKLIEMMRNYYYPTIQEVCRPITTHETDYRAKRITDYLNLVNKIVQAQVVKLKEAAFEKGTEITKYFDMLPEDSKVKQLYTSIRNIDNPFEKERVESFLRTLVFAGSIDVNIMTKLDGNTFKKNGEVPENCSDAVSALRGYANSTLTNSSVIFSAGLNPRLYNYLEKCPQFDADEEGVFSKKIVIKVSDYRSAFIQGKYLAKKGIWVSEFRIESGLNCGGHAFATDGYLMGPILEEFKTRKQELINTLYEMYTVALRAKNRQVFTNPHPIKITAQGGIGTFEEDSFLHNYYSLDSTGWGTPFLLVPEATTVDEATLHLLCEAKKEDVVLSNYSPLGIRFHYLKGSSAEKEKQARIHSGKPGSPCTEKHLAFNTEFTQEPICTASHKYQKLKIAQLQSLHLPEIEYDKQLNEVLDKECLCIGLSNGVAKLYNIPFVRKQPAVNICPGPNIIYFSKVVSLQTMTDHIYGRKNIIEKTHRPHMFIAELQLYINYLKEAIAGNGAILVDVKKRKYYQDFIANLNSGIDYYRNLPILSKIVSFTQALLGAEKQLAEIQY